MIEIKNLDFTYGKTKVFSNISLAFQPGRIYGLLGENGVGKTTLLKVICGLQRPQCGSCVVDGFSSFDRSPLFLQNIVFLPDEVTLPDNITPSHYIADLAPFYPNFAQATFLHLMNEFDLDPDRRFNAMSFGQQKKSLIACALSLHTDYLLLDEPTNGLDIPSKSQFRSLIAKRIDDHSTILIATHQVKDVENLIDPIVILSQDEVLLNASIDLISRRLFFEYDAQPDPDALFSEQLPGGCLNVRINTRNEESQVSIEPLFNAVLHNKQLIKELFK